MPVPSSWCTVFSPPWSVEWGAGHAPCFTYNLKTTPEIVFWLSTHAMKTEKLLSIQVKANLW